MIFVDRHKIEAPRFFSSKEHDELKHDLQDFYGDTKSKRAQKRYNKYRIPFQVRVALKELFQGRCAYCETKVELDDSVFDNLDHFRPRSNARGFAKGDTALDHYWWLTYEWHNMYLSCQDCNRFKANWFPVEGKRARPLTNYDAILKQEVNLILDPCVDAIEAHLGYDLDSGNLIPRSSKGEITIEILNLNRRRLIDGRIKALRHEYSNWEGALFNYRNSKDIDPHMINYWKQLFDGELDVDFVGARRALIRDRLVHHPELKGIVGSGIGVDISGPPPPGLTEEGTVETAVDDEPPEVSQTRAANAVTEDPERLDADAIADIKALLRNVYIEKIELKNYKCFDYLEVDVSKIEVSETEPWLMFLGENGVGKSSLIKAVAFALMGQEYLDALKVNPEKILKYRKHSGHIKVYGSNENEVYEVTFDKDSPRLISSIEQPPCYLLGYGSTRLMPKGALKPETDAVFVKTKNLFDYSVSLSNAIEWLLGLKKPEFDQVALSLKDLLLLDTDDVIKRNKTKKCVYINNIRNDIEDLSDGYKSIFAITVDIIQTLSKDNLAFQTAEAVVLIDEIGTHLHPRWKMEVVKRLRKTFKKIQFIVTTHEPLCLRGLKEHEVLVLKKDEDGKIISINDLPDPSDFRVDQLLTSEYFGLNSTLDFETEEKFKEYYELLAKETKTPVEEERIIKLSQELPNKIGNDIRDELVYHVIDELLAKQIKNQGFKLADGAIKAEAVNRVKEIWDFIDNHDQS